MTCHQIDGSGAQNMIPPLIKTDYVLGNKTRLIKLVLNGINGEMKVNGDLYAGEMPAHDSLSNRDLSAVLTYIRNNFGNKASPVTESDVRKVRSENKKK
jgi:mono/diheme cytochrome c family protein